MRAAPATLLRWRHCCDGVAMMSTGFDVPSEIFWVDVRLDVPDASIGRSVPLRRPDADSPICWD